VLPLHRLRLDDNNRLGNRLCNRLDNRFGVVVVFRHCVCVFHNRIILLLSSIVKLNQEPFWNYSRLDFTPSLPLEAIVNPHYNHCHCCCHAGDE
jgi:hypothetical protein